MAETQPKGERLFKVLGATSIGLLIAAASLSAGWTAFAGRAPEPDWMVRVSTVVWFVAMTLTGIAVVALFSGRRGAS